MRDTLSPERFSPSDQWSVVRGQWFARGARNLVCLLTTAHCLLLLAPARAQDPTDAPAESKGTRITFLPPPLEGPLSLGVYTREGKLVRVLAREATEEKFTVGLNGLITHWDGKDDAGKPLPPAKYFVRGYVVGDLGSDGVAFHGNDWIADEESPRPTALGEMRVSGGELLVAAFRDEALLGIARVDLEKRKLSFESAERERSEPAAASAAGELAKQAREAKGNLPRRAPGKDDTVWTIETLGVGGDARGVVAQRAGDEILRELEIPPTEPQPVSIAAATDRDEIFLLEKTDKLTRVRGLRLKETTAAAGGKKVSSWEVFLTRNLWKANNYAAFAAAFPRQVPFTPEEKVSIALVANPLNQTAAPSIALGIATDEAGSFLRTADGLPLIHVTDTQALKWAVLGREGDTKALTLFQSDGAVVEEFRIANPANIMAFDAGEYALASPAQK